MPLLVTGNSNNTIKFSTSLNIYEIFFLYESTNRIGERMRTFQSGRNGFRFDSWGGMRRARVPVVEAT